MTQNGFRKSSSLKSSAARVMAAALFQIGMLAGGANVAHANSAAADVTAPLRAAEANRIATPQGGDEDFQKLFASWQALDHGGTPSSRVSAISGSASIPMLAPIVSGRSMSSGFGMRVHPILGGYRAHKGVDLPAPTGTPIHATADGIVAHADWFGGYGLFVEIEHGANLETRYGHMSRIAVAEGQHVHKGDVIGYVGSTGRSTGSHLHYEVRIAGDAVNPLPYMQESEANGAILLAANGAVDSPALGSPED